MADPKKTHLLDQQLAALREFAAEAAVFYDGLLGEGMPKDVATQLAYAYVTTKIAGVRKPNGETP